LFITVFTVDFAYCAILLNGEMNGNAASLALFMPYAASFAPIVAD
jgi:hypothetical protein